MSVLLPLLPYKYIFYSCTWVTGSWFRVFQISWWFTELLSVPWRCGTHLYEDANHPRICLMLIYVAMGQLNDVIWTVTNQNSSWKFSPLSLSLSASFKCCLQMLYTIKYFQPPDPFYSIRYARFWWIVSVLKTRLVYFPSANYRCDYRPDWFEQIIDPTNWSFCQPTNKPCSW